MRQDRSGFTLVEVLVAVMVLSVGVTALVGSAGVVTRMIGRGQMGTRGAQMASWRLEQLRLFANSTSPRCTSGSFVGGTYTSKGITEKVVITVIAGTTLRTITDSVTYGTVKGAHRDVLTTQVRC
jgi:prepilin-type N-terminal cleavage/methylation domain-containing protein